MAHSRPRAAAPRTAVAPASAAASLRRVTGSWTEPEPWTVALLLVTGVALVARHPVARLIGTEAQPPAAAPTVASAPPLPEAAAVPTPAAAAVGVVATHAPRDPFRALVGPAGAVLAPTAISTGTMPAPARAPQGAAAARPAAPGSACAGTVHTVVSGDTLWTIAATSLKSSNSSRITIAWQRIYRANRPPLGADPSALSVGTRLCLPASL